MQLVKFFRLVVLGYCRRRIVIRWQQNLSIRENLGSVCSRIAHTYEMVCRETGHELLFLRE